MGLRGDQYWSTHKPIVVRIQSSSRLRINFPTSIYSQLIIRPPELAEEVLPTRRSTR